MRFYVFRFLITEFNESDCVPWSCKENDEDKKRSKLYRSTSINLMLFRTTDQDLFIALSIFVSSYIALGFTFRVSDIYFKIISLVWIENKSLVPSGYSGKCLLLTTKTKQEGKISPYVKKCTSQCWFFLTCEESKCKLCSNYLHEIKVVQIYHWVVYHIYPDSRSRPAWITGQYDLISFRNIAKS